MLSQSILLLFLNERTAESWVCNFSFNSTVARLSIGPGQSQYYTFESEKELYLIIYILLLETESN